MNVVGEDIRALQPSRRALLRLAASSGLLVTGGGVMAVSRTGIDDLPIRIEIEGVTSDSEAPSPSRSRVMVAVHIPLEAIRAKLEAIPLPLSGVEHDIVPGNTVSNDVLTYVAQRTPFVVTAEGGHLVVRTNLAGEVNARGTIRLIRGEVGKVARKLGKFLKKVVHVPTLIQVVFDQPVSVTLKFAARIEATAIAALTQDWRLKLDLGGGAKLDVAETHLGPFPLSLRGKLQPRVDDAVRDVLAKAARKVLEDDAVRNAVAEQWEALHRDIDLPEVSGPQRMVLSVRPREAIISQPVVDGSGVRILVGFETDTSIGSAPSPEPRRALPPPTIVPAEHLQTSHGIELNVSARLPYDVLAKVLVERLASGRPIRDPATGVAVTAQAVRFVPRAEALVAIVTGKVEKPGRLWTTRVQGEIALVVRPRLSEDRTEVLFAESSLADLSEAWVSSNGVIGAAAGALLTAALAGQRFALAEHMASARAASNDAIAQMTKGLRGVRLSMSIDGMAPTRLEVASDALLIGVEARGKARLDVDDLRLS